MLGWLIKRQIRAFEKSYNYDMTYARVLLDADPAAFRRFAKVMGIARYRKDVPRAVYAAAGLVGSMAEDCGPCTQLGTTMAEREGVPPEVLRAILERDLQAMPEDVALGFRFAEATLAHDPEADGLRDQVVARWGKRGLVSLGFALTAARLFPTLKYALGEGKACSRITIDGKTLAVARHQVA